MALDTAGTWDRPRTPASLGCCVWGPVPRSEPGRAADPASGRSSNPAAGRSLRTTQHRHRRSRSPRPGLAALQMGAAQTPASSLQQLWGRLVSAAGGAGGARSLLRGCRGQGPEGQGAAGTFFPPLMPAFELRREQCRLPDGLGLVGKMQTGARRAERERTQALSASPPCPRPCSGEAKVIFRVGGVAGGGRGSDGDPRAAARSVCRSPL